MPITLARPMKIPQGPLKILNLAFVIDLLPFSEFECLEHFLHFIECVLQFLDDAVHLLDGIGDGRGLVPRFRRFVMMLLPLLGFFDGGLGRFGDAGGSRGFTSLRRQLFAWLAAPGMAATTASGATPASGGCCFGWRSRAFFCFVRRHKHRLPRGN
jgi:hypothetical protein